MSGLLSSLAGNTSVDELISEVVKLAIIRNSLLIVIPVILEILSIYIYKKYFFKKNRDVCFGKEEMCFEELIASGILFGLILVFTIIVLISVIDIVGWIATPRAAFFDYVINAIGKGELNYVECN